MSMYSAYCAATSARPVVAWPGWRVHQVLSLSLWRQCSLGTRPLRTGQARQLYVLGNIFRYGEAKMAYKTPRVSDGGLWDDRSPGSWIPLDSPAWFAWLEAPEHCSFSYALMNHAKGYIDGFMTVRKEHRQRGGAYWTAYRRQGHSLRKVYLGPTPALTAARLAEAARRLYTPDGPSP